MIDATATVTDETALEVLVASPRALAALVGAGYKTLGDVRKAKLVKVEKVKGVGLVTLEGLRDALRGMGPAGAAATVQEPEKREETWEEGAHDVHLHSPHRGFQFPLKKARRLMSASGEETIQSPLWIEFDEGEARVSRRQWFLKVFDGDEVRVEEAVERGQPWRLLCVAWLRARRTHGRDFFVKTD